jgi:hypothetical protein
LGAWTWGGTAPHAGTASTSWTAVVRCRMRNQDCCLIRVGAGREASVPQFFEGCGLDGLPVNRPSGIVVGLIQRLARELSETMIRPQFSIALKWKQGTRATWRRSSGNDGPHQDSSNPIIFNSASANSGM